MFVTGKQNALLNILIGSEEIPLKYNVIFSLNENYLNIYANVYKDDIICIFY